MVAVNTSKVDNMTERDRDIDALRTEFHAYRDQNNRVINAFRTEVNERFNGVDKRLTSVETRLTSLETKVDNGFAEMYRGFAEMDRRFAEVDRGFAEIRGRLDGTAAGMAQIAASIDILIARDNERRDNERRDNERRGED